MHISNDIDGGFQPNHITFLHQNLSEPLTNLP